MAGGGTGRTGRARPGSCVEVSVPSGRDGRRKTSETSEGDEQPGAAWLGVEELQIGLARVPSELGRQAQAQEPQAQPLGLSPSPRARERRRPKRVQHLVGQHAEAPEQGVAVEVVDGRLPDRELTELGDALLDDGAPVVAAPRGECVDALDVAGWLPDMEYWQLLASVDVVVDLTTCEDCLVCGAYEAVAVGQPLVLSDTASLRNYFRRGVVFTRNEPKAIADALSDALARSGELRAEMLEFRVQLREEWAVLGKQFAKLVGCNTVHRRSPSATDG